MIMMIMMITMLEMVIKETATMKVMITLPAPRPLRPRKDLQGRVCTAHAAEAEGSGDQFQSFLTKLG